MTKAKMLVLRNIVLASYEWSNTMSKKWQAVFRRSAVKNSVYREYSSNVTYNKQVSIGLALSVLKGTPITSYKGIMADVF